MPIEGVGPTWPVARIVRRFDGHRMPLRTCLLLLPLIAVLGCRTARHAQGPPPPPRHPLASGRFEAFEEHPAPPPEDDTHLGARWDAWADENLRTGDVVFRRESWRVAGGTWDVTKFISKLADSNFSHVGIVSVEEGRAYVYDTTRVVGPRRTRFHDWLFAGMNFGIKRPRPEHRHAIPAAMAYVDRAHRDRVPFDPDFEYGDEKLYCTEMVVLAYRSAGVDLTERRAYEDFPRWREFPMQTKIAEVATGWTPSHEVYAPGNDEFGLWSSDALDLVLVGRSAFDPEVIATLPDAPPERAYVKLPNPE